MATLAAGIKTKAEAMVAATSRKELTNQRNSAATSQDDTLMTAACTTAAAYVAEHLGSDVDDSDEFAVSIGAQIAMAHLKGQWSLTFGDKPVTMGDKLMAELSRVRRMRIAGIGMEIVGFENDAHTRVNKRWKSQNWVEET